MPKKSKITNEIADLIIKLNNEGKNTTQISEIIGVSRPTITSFLNKNGIRQNSRNTEVKQKEILDFLILSENTITFKEVVKKCNTTPEVLRKLIENNPQYNYLIRTKNQAQSLRRLSSEEVNKRLSDAGLSDICIGFNEVSKKYIMQTQDSQKYEKSISHLTQGNPVGKNGYKISNEEINRRLKPREFELIEKKHKNLKKKSSYKHLICGFIFDAKFKRLESGLTKCPNCNFNFFENKKIEKREIIQRRIKQRKEDIQQKKFRELIEKKEKEKETLDKVNNIINKRLLGATIKEIVKTEGVSRDAIKRILKKNNVFLTKEQKEANVKRIRYNPESPIIASNSESYKQKMEQRKDILKKNIEILLQNSKISLSKINSHKKDENIELTCPGHGIFYRTYNILKFTQKCPKCTVIEKHQCKPYTYEEVKKFVEDRGHELASKEYKNSYEKIDIRCKKHGIFSMRLYSFNSGQDCYRCGSSQSKPEGEIFDFVKSLGFSPIRRDKSAIKTKKIDDTGKEIVSGVEIDIYVPEKRLGIEYNGLYFHSEKLIKTEMSKELNKGVINKETFDKKIEKKKNSHFMKFKHAEENGMSFFAIFGDEWISKKDLIKSMIRHRLGIYDKKIRASKLTFVESKIDKKIDKFFNESHIDGTTRGRFAYSLQLDGEIICCLSFRTNMETKMLEIARFATKPGYKVYGGFSRLIKKLPRNVDLLSYSNNRVGNGNVYKKHGFKQVEIDDPKIGYCYTDNKIRVSRHKCQKINDPEITKIYPNEESQALGGVLSKPFGHNKPIFKIYDYGNKKWILKL